MEEKGNEEEEVVEDEGVLGKTTREEGLALDSSESCREERRHVEKGFAFLTDYSSTQSSWSSEGYSF